MYEVFTNRLQNYTFCFFYDIICNVIILIIVVNFHCEISNSVLAYRMKVNAYYYVII